MTRTKTTKDEGKVNKDDYEKHHFPVECRTGCNPASDWIDIRPSPFYKTLMSGTAWADGCGDTHL